MGSHCRPVPAIRQPRLRRIRDNNPGNLPGLLHHFPIDAIKLIELGPKFFFFRNEGLDKSMESGAMVGNQSVA